MILVHEIPIDFKKFNDGTLRFNEQLPVLPFSFCPITWLYESEEEVSQLYFLVNHIRESYRASNLVLNMWYIPNARMDRVKSNHECFTLKYFCNFINMLNFNAVNVFDPHSDVSVALLNNVKVERPIKEIHYLLHKHPNITPFFCDEGAVKRYKDTINDKPFAFGVKDRDWSSQNINSLQIMGAKELIENHDILIIDDIISRGSTLYLASQQLKDMGANNIYVWASHCEATVMQPHINNKSLLDYPNLITKIYTTNSIYKSEHPKIEVMRHFI